MYIGIYFENKTLMYILAGISIIFTILVMIKRNYRILYRVFKIKSIIVSILVYLVPVIMYTIILLRKKNRKKTKKHSKKVIASILVFITCISSFSAVKVNAEENADIEDGDRYYFYKAQDNAEVLNIDGLEAIYIRDIYGEMVLIARNDGKIENFGKPFSYAYNNYKYGKNVTEYILIISSDMKGPIYEEAIYDDVLRYRTECYPESWICFKEDLNLFKKEEISCCTNSKYINGLKSGKIFSLKDYSLSTQENLEKLLVALPKEKTFANYFMLAFWKKYRIIKDIK